MEKVSSDDMDLLVFDLGAGTFDVTLIGLQDGIVEVKATCGESHLGGEDFDNKLMEFCMEQFLDKQGIDISKNPRALRRLKT
jgi:L1 cell adhesion molecule like protein